MAHYTEQYTEKVVYGEQPETVRYMPLPNGKADVWIRHDIRQEPDGENNLIWLAREVYLQTAQSQAEIESNAVGIFLKESGIQQTLTDAVQDWMDVTVGKRNYDSIFTACSYANSTNAKFRAEGEACVAWRDRVWERCYAILEEVMAGLRAIPTVDELLAQLRTELPLVWPEAA